MDKTTRWWVAGPGNEPIGPYDEEALRTSAIEGRVNGVNRVCREGTQDWLFAWEVPELGIARPTTDTGMGLLVPIDVPILAVAASWMGIFGLLLWPIAPFALVSGFFALRRVRAMESKGAGRAWTAIVCGALGSLTLALIVLASLVG